MKYVIVSPAAGTITDYEEMNLEEKLLFLRQHKEWKCPNKWELLAEHEESWRRNGLCNLQYKVLRDTCIENSSSRGRRIVVDITVEELTGAGSTI